MPTLTPLLAAAALLATPYRFQPETEAEPERRDPQEGEDPWSDYEPAPSPTPAPAAVPAPVATPAPAAAPAPAALPPERPRKPKGGLGLLVTGPILIAAGVPFSFWGNQVFRNGCVGNQDSEIDEAIGQGFECGLSATGSFLLHGVAFLFYAGGGVMTGLGGMTRGKHNAWEDAFITREPQQVTGLTAGGGALFGISLAALIGSRVALWVTMDQCPNVACVRARQTIATSVAAGSMVGVAAGGAMLGYGLGYSGRMRRWAPELIVMPSFRPQGYAGVSLSGRF